MQNMIFLDSYLLLSTQTIIDLSHFYNYFKRRHFDICRIKTRFLPYSQYFFSNE